MCLQLVKLVAFVAEFVAIYSNQPVGYAVLCVNSLVQGALPIFADSVQTFREYESPGGQWCTCIVICIGLYSKFEAFSLRERSSIIKSD